MSEELIEGTHALAEGDDEEWKQYVVVRDGRKDLCFRGRLLAFAATSPNNARSNYSGATGQWTELNLYRTWSGKYICQNYGGTQWEGRPDTSEAEICETEEQVFEFFGSSDLAKELYAEANLDFIVTVE